jgi:hypothetical protein
MRERQPAYVDMRLRQFGSLGDHDMGVNVDGNGRRPPSEAVRVVDTCGSAAISILAFDH